MPKQEVIRYRQRALVLRCLLNEMNIIRDRYGAARDFDDILLGIAITLGQCEGRPMTPTKLAQFLGLPRTTVIRRAANLIAIGYIAQNPVTKALELPLERLNHPDSVKVSQKMQRLIEDTAAALSKVDTQAVE